MQERSPTDGRALADRLSPGLAEALESRYGRLLPNIGRPLVDWLFADHYARPGLDLKTRKIVSVAVLAALGGQTRPQLLLNIADARKAGASREEIAEAIWQIGIYAGLPAAISGLNAALEAFESESDPEAHAAGRDAEQR
jgi:4-carboxymuconolactone decarboxylase